MLKHLCKKHFALVDECPLSVYFNIAKPILLMLNMTELKIA